MKNIKIILISLFYIILYGEYEALNFDFDTLRKVRWG